MLDLSIIIVHYKTPELLKTCIDSIFKSNTPTVRYEVIIVNNDTDASIETEVTEKYPNLKWLNSGFNAGFSRANNTGIRNAQGTYVLLLNPDTCIDDNFLEAFVNKYKMLDAKHNLGLLGCRIISQVDHRLLVGSGLKFPSIRKLLRANPLYIKLTRNHTRSQSYIPQEMHYQDHEIDFVSGACVLIKKAKVEQENLYLDEDFFLYFEDVEWSFRVQNHGFKNFFCGENEVYHINSASTGKSTFRQNQIFISEWLYYFKTHQSNRFALLKFIFWSNYKLNTWLLKRSNKSSAIASLHQGFEIFEQAIKQIEHDYQPKPSSGMKPFIYPFDV